MRGQGLNPHIVISTRDLQDYTILMTYLAEKAQDYYVCVEYGNNGHPHIEAFASFKSVQRQDKMKDKIIKLYNITDRIEKKNISVTFNSVDPDPKYGYGYACKEDPSVLSLIHI